MKKTWWKEGIIYQIYPRSFKDGNGDGVGDLYGVIEKLDYLKNLGIDIIWLSPIYCSPNDDNGYDISDYCNIMDEFGNMEVFDEMLEGIHKRGMRLLMDLVVNHTSDEHTWFRESKSSKDNPKRDYYIWRDKPNNWKSFFSGPAWEYDEQTEMYYLHLFSKKQPDLNWENPKLREEVYKLMRFWLDKGVDGFRMDVITLISKKDGLPDNPYVSFGECIEKHYANGPRVHEYLREMNQKVLSHYDIMTVGEAVGVPAELAELYVSQKRKEIDMIFHFGHLFLGQDNGRFKPQKNWDLVTVKNTFDKWDKAMGEDGWQAIYLDNHDFPRMLSRFGNDGKYREESAKLLITMLCTLKGTTTIYQGSEIGMTNVAFDSIDDYDDIEMKNAYKEAKENGEDMEAFMNAVHTEGRDNARTPIQWSDAKHAGFFHHTTLDET